MILLYASKRLWIWALTFSVLCSVCHLPSFFFFLLGLQQSKEGEEFEVDKKVAVMAKLVADMVEDGDDDEEEEEVKVLPIPNVSGPVLKKVIGFCEHYQEEEMTPIETPLKSNTLEELVQTWYAEFVKVDRNMLFDLVAAANFMDIKPLLDLTCLAVAILIKGKSPDELREMFNIRAEMQVDTPDDAEKKAAAS